MALLVLLFIIEGFLISPLENELESMLDYQFFGSFPLKQSTTCVGI
jgi:hypothetical protein